MSGTVQVLSTDAGTKITSFNAAGSSPHRAYSLSALAGSPDGEILFIGVGAVITKGDARAFPEESVWSDQLESTNAVRLVRVSDGKTFATFAQAHAPIRGATWDPRGRFVAFIDNTARLFIWNSRQPNDAAVIDLPTRSMALAIDRTGDRLAVATDKGVQIFRVAN